MCGIVGLLVKRAELRVRLGEWATPMFVCMADRGLDSGGMAVFGSAQAGTRRMSLFVGDRQYDWQRFLESFRRAFSTDSAEILGVENHGILITSVAPPRVKTWLAEFDSALLVLSVGRSMDIFKDQGTAREISRRYRFAELTGTHCVGHTRMATESAVTPAHSHPFTAGEDFCLVHNGSLSNPYMLCRMLEKQGVHFDTDNDTEAACRFIEWRLREGDSLNLAIERAFEELDGFYTLLMATTDAMTLVRDAFACKPAVVAETDDYVAVSSEFRSMAHLPGVADAKIFEPQPETIYSWRV